MALITCPDCGHSISDAPTACIHCGRPLDLTPAAVAREAAVAPAVGTHSQVQVQAEPSSSAVTLPLFPVATHKFIILSICSFSIYELYWCYQTTPMLQVRAAHDLLRRQPHRHAKQFLLGTNRSCFGVIKASGPSSRDGCQPTDLRLRNSPAGQQYQCRSMNVAGEERRPRAGLFIGWQPCFAPGFGIQTACGLPVVVRPPAVVIAGSIGSSEVRHTSRATRSSGPER